MSKVSAEPVPQPEWVPLARPGSHSVQAKVLLQQANLQIALLRFESQSTIDEHSAPHAIDVICLEGAGMFSIGGEVASLHAGERVQWPADRPHRLWTDAGTMLTLMVEHLE
jgi:quercetin dioxygenase-like cupin family protein